MQIRNNYDREVFNGDIGRVTRGKKLVVMVGSRKAMAIGVSNNKTQKRYTRLRYRLS